MARKGQASASCNAGMFRRPCRPLRVREERTVPALPASNRRLTGVSGVRNHARLQAAVVAAEDEQRIAARAGLVHGGDDLADRFVHCRQHAGVLLPFALEICVGLQVFGRRLIRAVNRVERYVEEERLLARRVADEINRLPGDELRAVAFIPASLVIAVPVEGAVTNMR